MDFMFIDGNAAMKAIIQNNMTAAENEYAGLEVALAMQKSMAANTELDQPTRDQYTAQVSATQGRMSELDDQWNSWKAQYDAL